MKETCVCTDPPNFILVVQRLYVLKNKTTKTQIKKKPETNKVYGTENPKQKVTFNFFKLKLAEAGGIKPAVTHLPGPSICTSADQRDESGRLCV
jgi:hypothetical protein